MEMHIIDDGVELKEKVLKENFYGEFISRSFIYVKFQVEVSIETHGIIRIFRLEVLKSNNCNL